jgi:hypothetical protein
LLGFLSGIVVAAWQWGMDRWLPAGDTAFLITVLGPPLVCGIGFGALLPRLTQRAGHVFVLGGAFWAAMDFACEQAPPIAEGSMGAGFMSLSGALWMLVELAVAGLIGGLIGLALLWVTRLVLFVTQEQDGQWCWRCGYRTGSERITVCPECGTPVDAARFKWNRLHRCVALGRRVGWIGAALLVLLGVAYIAANWSDRIAPAARFAERMGRFGTIACGNYYAPGSSPVSLGTPCLGAARLPLDPASALDLLVVYRPDVSPGGTVMQLQLFKVVGVSVVKVLGMPGDVTEASQGVPRILCDLNDEQAEEVMEHGVPQSLKDAMLKATAGVSWDGWAGTAPVPADVRVDPAPHFAGH